MKTMLKSSIEKNYSFTSSKYEDESAKSIATTGRDNSQVKTHRNSSIFENLLPVYQSKIYNMSKETNHSHSQQSNNGYKQLHDAHTQCTLTDFRLCPKIASCLTLSTNALFIPFEMRRFNIEIHKQPNNLTKKTNATRVNNTLSLREIGVQTYADLHRQSNHTSATILEYDLDKDKKTKIEKSIEDLIYNIFMRDDLFASHHSQTLKLFVHVLEKLSEESLVFLSQNLTDFKPCVESLIRLNSDKVKALDLMLLKIGQSEADEAFDLERLIKTVESKRKGVRFETSEEKRRAALDRFKKAIRFVIINREWFKNLSKDKKEEREKLILEYSRVENCFLTGKKIQMLFNKEEFRAQKNLSSSITDVHKQILTKEQFTRSKEQVEILLGLIASIPRLNTLPKHVSEHVAQLMKLLIYDKGREIVREGHLAVGFYFIITGSCDVLSMGVDGLLKVDELQSADCFGDCSFQSGGVTPHTVITNRRTELLTVVPADIETYLNKVRFVEREEVYEFISSFRPAKYWNWKNENFRKFAEMAEFLRFAKGDVIYDGAFQSNDKLYFILKGKVELIRLLDLDLAQTSPKRDMNLDEATLSLSRSNSVLLRRKISEKLIRICYFEKFNYFGLANQSQMNTWYLAVDDQVELVSITRQHFLSIHKHSKFLLSQLVEDYKLAVPDAKQEIAYYTQRLKFDKLIGSFNKSF